MKKTSKLKFAFLFTKQLLHLLLVRPTIVAYQAAQAEDTANRKREIDRYQVWYRNSTQAQREGAN
jgi:hypothetical protein